MNAPRVPTAITGDVQPLRQHYRISFTGRDAGRFDWTEADTPLKAQRILSGLRGKGFEVRVDRGVQLLRVRK